MTNFERVKMYFEKGWATIQQVKLYVQFERITETEFLEITGEEYVE
ncbi:XkdX family protein [Chengkuizengella axinellae]|uniref:XkdX family protein n=1 Tax=Chengkuizengella axinellae TaxID=3064388 RepID=A0ABT9IYC4_9BACL|nr:XkdX family protein [Chengkuizengella sp. 2205SS18-9]MDP5274360.1 XkdX family protein [Chengkuizengella sp. 2205SS18-9]